MQVDSFNNRGNRNKNEIQKQGTGTDRGHVVRNKSKSNGRQEQVEETRNNIKTRIAISNQRLCKGW